MKTHYFQSTQVQHYIQRLRNAGYEGQVQILIFRFAGKDTQYDMEVDFLATIPDQIQLFREQIPLQIERLHLTRITTESEDLDRVVFWLSEQPGEYLETLPFKPKKQDRPPYWSMLRPHIQDSLIYSPGLMVLIRNDEGKILVVRRSDDGEWSLPAGSRELEENIFDTAVQEMYEELGIHVRLSSLAAIFSGPKMWWMYPNGHIMQFTGFAFRGEIIAGEPAISDNENHELRWVSEEEANRLFDSRWQFKLSLYKNPGIEIRYSSSGS
jgi:8-oxo-dGTP diphosphatase